MIWEDPFTYLAYTLFMDLRSNQLSQSVSIWQMLWLNFWWKFQITKVTQWIRKERHDSISFLSRRLIISIKRRGRKQIYTYSLLFFRHWDISGLKYFCDIGNINPNLKMSKHIQQDQKINVVIIMEFEHRSDN